MISGIASYSDNVSISCNMSYSLSMSLFGLFPIADDIPFSAVVKRTFMLLPEDEDYLPVWQILVLVLYGVTRLAFRMKRKEVKCSIG